MYRTLGLDTHVETTRQEMDKITIILQGHNKHYYITQYAHKLIDSQRGPLQ